LAVFLPTFKFTSVVIQTAKILTPKNVLAARPQCLSKGKMTFKREAVSRIVQQIFGSTPSHNRESPEASPLLELNGRPQRQAPSLQYFGG
jgi:hypothetical protein